MGEVVGGGFGKGVRRWPTAGAGEGIRDNMSSGIG